MCSLISVHFGSLICLSESLEKEDYLLTWLFGVIKNLMNNEFTGNLKINFFKGGITNLNKEESIVPPDEDSKKQ